MPYFIIDNNLPKNCNHWQGREFIHVFDLDPSFSDTQIWEYARLHNAIIISKDTDFSNRILSSSPPPRVIHIKLGNYRTKELEHYLSLYWERIIRLLKYHKLIEVYFDRIEGIK